MSAHTKDQEKDGAGAVQDADTADHADDASADEGNGNGDGDGDGDGKDDKSSRQPPRSAIVALTLPRDLKLSPEVTRIIGFPVAAARFLSKFIEAEEQWLQSKDEDMTPDRAFWQHIVERFNEGEGDGDGESFESQPRGSGPGIDHGPGNLGRFMG
ncbi:hypothetical protein F5Y17DRAFT_426297 [Xylariaceae sp. FL0594]|nr:hypothetical protein F5Y17DRAFT_426297 [Xylariaceae sp. FL0594]